MSLTLRGACVALASITWVSKLMGQDSACTYDRCSLRLQYRFSGIQVVQGLAATPVAKLTMFSGRVPQLALSPDSTVRQLYREYRHSRNVAAVFTVASAVIGL